MYLRALHYRFQASARLRLYLILGLWLLGLMAGICFANVYDSNLKSAGEFVTLETASPFGQLLVAVLPPALIAMSLFCSSFPLICLVVAVEALCRGYCGMLTIIAFDSGAWLMRSLLLPSSACASTLMWWLIIRHQSTVRRRFAKDVLICMLSAVFVSVVDIFYISPFLTDLLKHI